VIGVALLGRSEFASKAPEPAPGDSAGWTAAAPDTADVSGAGRREDNEPSSRGGAAARDEVQGESLGTPAAAVETGSLQVVPNGTLTAGQQLIVPWGPISSEAVRAKRDASLDGAGAAAAVQRASGPAALPEAGRDTGTDEAGRQSGSSRSGVRTAVTTVQVETAIDANPAHWEFIQAAIEPAQDSQRETGVPASVTIGQAIHESAWGTSRLSREGNNYFGIKATNGPGPRGVINARTWEHIDGENLTVTDAFRAYNNKAESFVDHGRFLLDNKRYAAAMGRIDDPRAFIRLVAAAGYATDPNYTRKVLAYLDRYDLYQYDLVGTAE